MLKQWQRKTPIENENENDSIVGFSMGGESPLHLSLPRVYSSTDNHPQKLFTCVCVLVCVGVCVCVCVIVHPTAMRILPFCYVVEHNQFLSYK